MLNFVNKSSELFCVPNIGSLQYEHVATQKIKRMALNSLEKRII